jgi:glycosyltransferase involved in cell wall biosynthesis
MRILIVSSYLAFRETRSGGSKRMYNIAHSLEREHDLSVVCFDGSNERPQWNGQSCFRRFLLLAEDRGTARWKWAHHLDARSLLAARGEALAAFLGREPFDCVILAYPMAPNLLRFPAVSAARRIVYIEGDLNIVQADALRKTAPWPARKILKEIRYRQTLRYYRGFLAKIHVFFLSTETEIREVRRRFPGVATAQLPIGMDVPSARLPPPAPDAEAIAGFLGNFQHPPNLHAVTWYLDAVHPILKARHARYRFVIAGMNIPDALRSRAADDSSLLILGSLDDLEPYYRRISFAVNPIVSGKGVRTKVVEAAAYGRAIVSTSLGADGTEPLHVNRSDGAEAFADACSRLIRNGTEAEPILRRNREIVETGFSDAAIRDRLLASPGAASP